MNHAPKSQIPGGFTQILYILKGFESDSGMLISYEEIVTRSKLNFFHGAGKMPNSRLKN